jgi:hypothetical protein
MRGTAVYNTSSIVDALKQNCSVLLVVSFRNVHSEEKCSPLREKENKGKGSPRTHSHNAISH